MDWWKTEFKTSADIGLKILSAFAGYVRENVRVVCIIVGMTQYSLVLLLVCKFAHMCVCACICVFVCVAQIEEKEPQQTF